MSATGNAPAGGDPLELPPYSLDVEALDLGPNTTAVGLELLETEDVLLVPGSSFNVPYRNHFRVTLLPEPDALREVFHRIDRVLSRRAGRDLGEAERAQRAAVA